ncbi:hypothetical protein NDU88_009700 [Pleurodeles waltl]|uniref:Uncharacterized protein n=1 Tax=Pleurodeles waltl TaxID=8319 RepID=A0AAV7RXB8_PLEWA|nr:hypothetical protein NDU88_009700 [Pleurodeles waltl]
MVSACREHKIITRKIQLFKKFWNLLSDQHSEYTKISEHTAEESKDEECKGDSSTPGQGARLVDPGLQELSEVTPVPEVDIHCQEDCDVFPFESQSQLEGSHRYDLRAEPKPSQRCQDFLTE